VNERKNPIEQAIELAVYAPIGLAALARDLGTIALADLAKRGREEIENTQKRVTNQVTQYRFVGQYAVDQEIKPKVEPLVGQVRSVLGLLTGAARAGRSGSFASPSPTVNGNTSPASSSNGGAPSFASTTNTPASAPPSPAEVAANRAAAAALPIPEYDELSASQVVERLAGLTPSELDAVARYEGARRRRKTILTRIEQLTR